jgi:hypothetical protein
MSFLGESQAGAFAAAVVYCATGPKDATIEIWKIEFDAKAA